MAIVDHYDMQLSPVRELGAMRNSAGQTSGTIPLCVTAVPAIGGLTSIHVVKQ